MTEWLGRRTCNPKVAGPSPSLTTKLELFLGRPQFNSSVILVNSQLVRLPSVEILSILYLVDIFVSFSLSGMLVN